MKSISEIVEQLERIESRLTRIESALPPPAPPIPPTPRAPKAPIAHSPHPDPIQRYEEPNEESSTGKLLGIIGIICFIIGAAFLIKLSIDSGWLTPIRQIALAALTGAALVGVGVVFREKDLTYLSILPAGGVVILYLTISGGLIIYDLYSPIAAIILMNAVSGLTLHLSRIFKTKIYVGIGVVGTYLSTWLLPPQTDLALLTTYFILWDVIFSILSIALKSRMMLLLASYLAILTFAQNVGRIPWELTGSESLPLIACIQAFQFMLFAISIGVYSIKNKLSLKSNEAWAYFPALLLFYGIEYNLLHRINPAIPPYIALAFAGVVYAVYNFAKIRLRTETLPSVGMVSTFVCIVILHTVYLDLMDVRWQIWCAPALLIAVPFLTQKLDLKGRHVAVTLMITFIVILGYTRSIAAYDGLLFGEQIALNFLFFILLMAGYRRSKGSNEGTTFILWLAHIQFLFGARRLVESVSDQWDLSSELYPFLVSSVWGLFGLALLVWAMRRRDAHLAYSSLPVLGFTTLKVVFVDASTASGIVRTLCFLGMGGVLYSCGYLFQKITRWKGVTGASEQ